jgi:hypothetical protein
MAVLGGTVGHHKSLVLAIDGHFLNEMGSQILKKGFTCYLWFLNFNINKKG